jgi:nucleotide-binding universal stress UspA family protein
MLVPTKILVPTDFSEYSDKALEQALDIAKQYNAKVFLLHVMHEMILPASSDSGYSEELVQLIRDRRQTETQEKLNKQLCKFPQAKEVAVVTTIRQGISYETILDEAKEKGIDLIVIASLGRSGIAKYLIGSVARNVLKGAKCPVLLTK